MKIGIIGCFQNGKSTLINCLLGAKLAQTGGDGVAVTAANTIYCYALQNAILSVNGKKYHKACLRDVLNGQVNNASEICIGFNSRILQNITIVDTPGFNANAKDTQVALASLKNIDVALMVINNRGISDVEIDILRELQARHLPYYIVMNCLMQQAQSTWNPDSDFNQSMLESISSCLENNKLRPMLLGGRKITAINIIWYWYAKTRFIFDSQEKQRKMINMMEYYAEDFPNTDYLIASNVMPLIRFFALPLNLLSLKVYTTLHANTDRSLRQIVANIGSYSYKFSCLTKSN